jgi:hypothetical protein
LAGVLLAAPLILSMPTIAAEESGGSFGDWGEEATAGPGDGEKGGGKSWNGGDTGSDGRWSAGGFDGNDLSLYGYVETSLNSRIDDDGKKAPAFGAASRTRVKAEWTPSDVLTARLEAVHRFRTGVANETVMAGRLGLSAPGMQATDANDDYLSSMELDHAWASVSLNRLDLWLGTFPIAWGSAYVFNPTDHVNAAGSLEGRDAETPGTAALAPTLYLGEWALGGYLALQQKGAEPFALQGSTKPENLPFAVRLRGYVAGFDVTLSAAKEVRYTGAPGGALPTEGDASADWAPAERYRRHHYVGFDTIGSLGDLGLYTEAALELPQDGNEIDFTADHTFEEALEAAVGLEYTFADGWSGGGLSLKAEYAHLGGGATDSAHYDFRPVIEGSAITVAEDYLFLYASRTYLDFWVVTLSSLLNLNDGSLILAPETSYAFDENFEGRLEFLVPLGPNDSEFDGTVDQANLPSFDLFEPEITLSFKASF